MKQGDSITVQVVVRASLAMVWQLWTGPEHITRWAFASNDWETPSAENDMRVGGRFRTLMAAKDNSTSFEFSGTYTEVSNLAVIAYVMDDGRRVRVEFLETPEGVRVTEVFDPEHENSTEVQRSGWQAILGNFKKYVESKG